MAIVLYSLLEILVEEMKGNQKEIDCDAHKYALLQ